MYCDSLYSMISNVEKVIKEFHHHGYLCEMLGCSYTRNHGLACIGLSQDKITQSVT